ncbi:MAG: hypothetical protein L0G99_18055, partial [Propionibacteriales bacterium]|nr:hypothetical protein [Propionibacteriales bacterium]
MKKSTKWIISGGAAAFLLAPIGTLALSTGPATGVGGTGYVAEAAPAAEPAPATTSSGRGGALGDHEDWVQHC